MTNKRAQGPRSGQLSPLANDPGNIVQVSVGRQALTCRDSLTETLLELYFFPPPCPSGLCLAYRADGSVTFIPIYLCYTIYKSVL